MTARIVDVEALRGHTPAPWAQYVKDPLVIVDRDGASIGEMTAGSPEVSIDEQVANARLTVASPYLLAEVVERRARDAQVAELVEAVATFKHTVDRVRVDYSPGSGIPSHELDAHIRDREAMFAALSAIRGGATG